MDWLEVILFIIIYNYLIYEGNYDSKQLNQTGENLKIDLQDIIENRNDESIVAARDIFYVGHYISEDLESNHASIFRWINYKNLFLLVVYTRYKGYRP